MSYAHDFPIVATRLCMRIAHMMGVRVGVAANDNWSPWGNV